MKLGVKIAVAFVLALLIIGIVGVQSYQGIQKLIEANHWVIHTHEVREKLEDVLSLLKDAETGQRGFVLTGEDSYLEPYNSATGDIGKKIEAVASLTRDNPEQQKSIQQLRELSRDKLYELGETIKLRRETGMEAALAVIRSGRGKRTMDEIRALVKEIESSESGLLDRRNRVADEVARRSMLMLGFGVLLSLVVLGVAAVIVTDTMRLADSSLVSRDPGRKWGRIAVRYTFALAMVVLATGVRLWLVRSFGPTPLLVTMYPAVLLVAALAGGGPGVGATLLSVLAADYWFIEPVGQFSIAATNDAVALGIFAGTGIFLSVLAERLQRARRAEAVSVTQEKELALLNMGNLMVLDLDHSIVRWSEGNRRLYGYDTLETQGQLTYELLRTHFDQPLEQIQSELLEKGHWEGEVTRLSKDGTQLSLAILWALRRDEGGKPLAILEVSTDMTRQKLAEESLQQQAEELTHQNEELSQQSEELSELNEELQTQSEEIQAMNVELGQREKMLQTLLDSARLPIGEQEVMGKLCHLATEMIGPPATGVVVCEQHGDELKILAHAGFDDSDVPGSWPLTCSFVEVVMQQDRTACLEDTSLRPDLNLVSVAGHQRFGSVLSSPLRVKGRPIGAISIYSNNTQQWTVEQFRLIEWLAVQCSNTLEAMRADEKIKKLNDDLLKRNDDLEFANKELESFIYSVSHDLRGPIRAISGFSEMMMKDVADRLDEKGKRYFSRILDGTEKMSRLIDDLLNLSRISRQEIQCKEVDLSSMAASIITELLEIHPGRSVEVEIKGGLTAHADPGLIELVFSNLLGNAWKFTGKTEHARIEFGTAEQDEKIIYYVVDNGSGFDQKYAGKMFWPFHRLHSEAEFEGTGIGLAIVDRIIGRHGGKVWAEGTEGKGATIYFTLPEVTCVRAL